MAQKTLILCLLPIVFLVIETEGQCPDTAPVNSTYFKTTGKCYYYNNASLIWLDARKSCVSLGGDLVSIHSYEERKFLWSYYSSYGDGTYYNYWFWIGLSSYLNPQIKNCSWSDGSAFDYLPTPPWAGNQSCSGDPISCVLVAGSSQEWFGGIDCADPRNASPSMCEILHPTCPTGESWSNLYNNCTIDKAHSMPQKFTIFAMFLLFSMLF